MGEHDQTVDKDSHRPIHDDGRILRPVREDEYLLEYDEAGYPSGKRDLPSYARQAFLFRGNELIPETVYVHGENFTATEWEAEYSNLTGSGDEQTFTPVINDSYRVVGHFGWIGGHNICVPRKTIADYSPSAVDFQQARLREWQRQRVWSYNHPLPRLPGQSVSPAPTKRPDICWPANKPPAITLLKPEDEKALWKSLLEAPPGQDPSEELRIRENMNFFLAGGGTAIVGRRFGWYLVPSERWDGRVVPYDTYLTLPYRCLVLVGPDGHIQEMLRVEWAPPESRNEKILRVALEVIDLALTIWMIIDIVTIPVALFRLTGELVAREALVQAVRLHEDLEVKAVLEGAAREAAAKASGDAAKEVMEAEAKAALRGKPPLPGPPEDFPFGSGRAPLPAPEAPNKVYRIMSMDEAAQALKARKLPPHLPGKESARFVSLDSLYAMLFREKELADLSKLGVGIEKAEANLAKVEERLAAVKATGGDTAELEAKADALRAAIDNRGLANRATADPVIKEWYEAPGQKVVVEIELEPGALNDILGRSVETNVFRKYYGKDVYLWKLERGYGRNIGIPTWQIDAFNSRIRNIRLYAERGLKLVGERKLPAGMN